MHPLELPTLPYAFDALQPAISKQIMELHYTKHHQAYVNNFNAALTKLDEAMKKDDLQTVLSLQAALKFNGGGHVNHSIFWKNLAPVGKGGEPSGALIKSIEARFGSLNGLKEALNGLSGAVQGSGWGWLAWDRAGKCLTLATCANQDPLQATTGLVPLLGFDVWEHAYYLQYLNVRADYLKALWQIVNWNDVQARYEAEIG
ncbi:MAG: superoxide dismutase [Chlamydiia bacterium]